MKVKFKNNTKTYECSEPVEQKLFKSGAATGWTIMFHIYGDTCSTEIDRLITPENISELTFLNDVDKEIMTISGYMAITSCVIRHKENTVSELQFVKITETATEEVTENA